MTATTDERAPLIQNRHEHVVSDEDDGAGVDDASRTAEPSSWLYSKKNRLLACAALITFAFDVNQITQLYSFYLMECDIYWDKHGPWDGVGDRCHHGEIGAGAAMQYGILCMMSNLFGVINLFIVGWMIRKWGPRATVIIQVLIPGFRILIQVVGIVVGKRQGEFMIQASQIVTIVGGPSGYRLALNTIAGELVPPERRTAIFGELQGVILICQGMSRLAGGYIGDRISILAPYWVGLATYIVSAAVARYNLPYVSVESLFGDAKKGSGGGAASGISAFIAPLKVLVPQKLRLPTGRRTLHYGVTFLCAGIFLGVLATGCSASLLQLYATSEFAFDQTELAMVMFEFCVVRGFFLVVIFPRIIDWGRRWFRESSDGSDGGGGGGGGAGAGAEQDGSAETLLPPSAAMNQLRPDIESYQFDLFFLRWSYLCDGMFMFLGAAMSRSWHVHMAALVLPLASGSAAAAKGTITAMTPSIQRADALNAMNMTELAARLVTQGLFGIVFATFAGMGHTSWTFFCNGMLALVALSVLILARYPPRNSVLLESDEESDEGEEPNF